MFLHPQMSSMMTRSWQRKLVRVAGIITKVLILNGKQSRSFSGQTVESQIPHLRGKANGLTFSNPSIEDLSKATTSQISDLRNGMKDVIVTVQVESWQSRTFTNSDGEEKIVRSGDVMDPSGRCRLTAWCEIEPKPGDFLHLNGARVQFWQGSPDLVVDNSEQIQNLSEAPWDAINPENHWVQITLSDLVNGGSRRGIKTTGTIVAVKNDSGIIERCPEMPQ